jgi:hypothetical protein
MVTAIKLRLDAQAASFVSFASLAVKTIFCAPDEVNQGRDYGRDEAPVLLT